ncbi:hypothetical protein P43SY_006090 [Pythium insidiosum]|uniref:Prolyl 4-hydroxylase alpha subunit domain-containing protein n=1 Tax=Pythium insidiosum TaxID=114742 RepID=A0AAD5LID1_PYTIN|nr:hypothetical protein P43SY_006090 [Pythium insidiosum]
MARKQVQPPSPDGGSSSPKSSPAASPKAATAKETRHPPPSPVKKASSAKKTTPSSLGFLAYGACVALVAVLSVALVPREAYVPSSDAPVDVGVVARRLASSWTALTVHVDAALGGSPSKYKTDIVGVEPRVFVSAEACGDEFVPTTLLDGRVVAVTEAMRSPPIATSPEAVFFMLNGQNEGVYMSWNGKYECIARAAEAAALWLGADADELANGVRLYSQMGHAVRNLDELRATEWRVHILLDFQLWQWPGIEKGYVYTLEDGVQLTTVGLTPKVFDVQYFLTAQEAEKIRALGMPSLNRSKVDGTNSSTIVSKARTSHTAFLEDDSFTRDFRRRSTRVARLPSPSYAERLQLVRYAAGEFYRQHLDTFHSRDFLPKSAGLLTLDDYKNWANWAAAKLRELAAEGRELPLEFQEGQPLFPNADDDQVFPNAFLDVFYHDVLPRNWLQAEFDDQWITWLRSNIDKNATNMMPALMKEDGKPHYLPWAIRAWERKLGLREVQYTMPKPATGPNGATHYFRWIRWAKERVSYLGDYAPRSVQPAHGDLYPQFTVAFMNKMLDLLLDTYSQKTLTRAMNADWYGWVTQNRGKNFVLYEAVAAFPTVAELAIRAWERAVGRPDVFHYVMPAYARHFHPQRYVTLFLYLNNETKIGGETVFPFSVDRFNDDAIERDGMSECSTGLAVPPRGLHASLFYVQTPEGEVDKMSRHGGCPPHEGVKWGSNSFMWNADADEGADLWTTK